MIRSKIPGKEQSRLVLLQIMCGTTNTELASRKQGKYKKFVILT